jgi:hypothetical protein
MRSEIALPFKTGEELKSGFILQGSLLLLCFEILVLREDHKAVGAKR